MRLQFTFHLKSVLFFYNASVQINHFFSVKVIHSLERIDNQQSRPDVSENLILEIPSSNIIKQGCVIQLVNFNHIWDPLVC